MSGPYFFETIWGDPMPPTFIIVSYQKCLVDEFFRRSQELPPHMRNNAAFISCPCPKCNSAKW